MTGEGETEGECKIRFWAGGLGSGLSIFGTRGAWRARNSRESMGEDGNKDDERDVRDQGDACHDAAAEPPGSSICR